MGYAKVICVYIENESEVNKALEIITDSLQDKCIYADTEVITQITDYII